MPVGGRSAGNNFYANARFGLIARVIGPIGLLKSMLLHRYERSYGNGCRATRGYIKHSQAEVCHFFEFLPASLVNGRCVQY
jgi:hypothetical protein